MNRSYDPGKSFGLTDLPWKAEREDILGIEKYVKGLADFIRHCPTPMSIAIQGDWGTGKTSIINRLQANLNQQKDGQTIIHLYFNTWQYSQFNMADDLYLSFASNLAQQLEEKAKVFDGLNQLRNKVIDTFKLLSFSILKKAAPLDLSEMEKFINTEQERAKAVETLKKDFQEMVTCAVKGNGRLVIFIDDLDRLNPETAVELLEVIKLFMDVENCVFVLAVDYSVVVSGVRKKFGSDISEAKCRSFFDKIIQLPFRMPVESYDLKRLLQVHLRNYLDDNHIPALSGMISCILGANPRTFTRLANSFFLIYSVQSNSNERPPSREQELQQNALILASLCMQMGVPHIYSAILQPDTVEDLSKLIREGAKQDPSSKDESQSFLKTNGINSDLSDDELELFPSAMDQLSLVIKTVLGGTEDEQFQTFQSVLSLSSITVVESKSSVRQPVAKIVKIIIDGKEETVNNLTEAFARTFSYALTQLRKQDQSLFSSYLKKHQSLLSETKPKEQGYFRSCKNISVGETELYLGVNTGSVLKTQQAKSLCSFCSVPPKHIQWLEEDGSVYFST